MGTHWWRLHFQAAEAECSFCGRRSFLEAVRLIDGVKAPTDIEGYSVAYCLVCPHCYKHPVNNNEFGYEHYSEEPVRVPLLRQQA